MRKERYYTTLIVRWVLYIGILLLAFALQTTPGFLRFGNAAPLLVVPASLAFCLYEGQFTGALVGAAMGLLWDAAAGRIGGFFALMLLAACFLSGCFWQLYLRDSWVNFIALTFAVCLLVLTIDFIFSYWLRMYPAPGQYYLQTVLPMCIVTAAAGWPFRLLVRKAATVAVKPPKP